MAVYVDEVFSWPIEATAHAARAVARKTGGKWCHMWADSEAELLAFGEKLGLKRAWVQKLGTPSAHFDLTPNKRLQALRLGAKTTTTREWLLKTHPEIILHEVEEVPVSQQPLELTSQLTTATSTLPAPSIPPVLTGIATSNTSRPTSPYDS